MKNYRLPDPNEEDPTTGDDTPPNPGDGDGFEPMP